MRSDSSLGESFNGEMDSHNLMCSEGEEEVKGAAQISVMKKGR